MKFLDLLDGARGSVLRVWLIVILLFVLLPMAACESENPAVPRAWMGPLKLEQPTDEKGAPVPMRVEPEVFGELRERFRAYELGEVARLNKEAEEKKAAAAESRDEAKAAAERKARAEELEKSHRLEAAKLRHAKVIADADAELAQETALIGYDLKVALAGVVNGAAAAERTYAVVVAKINNDTAVAINTLHAESQGADATAALNLARANAAAERNERWFDGAVKGAGTVVPLVVGTGGVGAAALSIIALLGQVRKRKTAEVKAATSTETVRRVAEDLETADDGGDLAKFVDVVAAKAEPGELKLLHEIAKEDGLSKLAGMLRKSALTA